MPEVENLRQLIAANQELVVKNEQIVQKSQELLRKLGRTLNIMLIVAGIIFIPFLYSFVDINVKISNLEEKKVSREEMYEKFVQKVDALAVHMFEQDWINTQLYKITSDPEYKNSQAREILIKGFFEETHRGENK